MPFYAVARGHRPGVYISWDDAKKQVDRFHNARYKKFNSEKEALAFIAENCDADVSIGTIYNQIEAIRSDRAVYNQNEAPRSDRAVYNQNEAPRSDRAVYNQTEAARSNQVSAQGPLEHPASIPTNLRYFNYYAVAKGRVSGIYPSWAECKSQVEGMFSAKFKGFSTLEDAQLYIDEYKRWQQANPSDPDPMNSSTLVAFTDGSAVNNGQAGLCRAGWACVFPHNPAWHKSGKVSGWKQTNNRAEYWGVIEAIRRANKEDSARVEPLYIFSDSMLLIRSMTEWVSGWIEQGWTKADGKPVLNSDLLKTLVQEQGERRIIWKHVRAHTNGTDWESKWNDLADQMAKEETRRF